ncbi:High-affinity proline transporter PutP [Candidatus Cardinium hertigii]|uniref:High-affinity proline transporter PutP n=2 Tax=Candidatus Cardinium hertigii TaxID=247481 RepID=A0A2Z3L7M2_9BACT|nr:High-affinity proline transporter PutP [Candidatus Cardinium hertigii]
MVIGFLLLTLVVGLYYSRKVTTFREYAVGNKQFATATLVATLLASEFSGGGLLRGVEQTHAQGLFWILFGLSSPIAHWILTSLMLRMGPFMQHLSLAESISTSYGKMPRLVVALVSVIVNVIMVTMQIIAMTKAIEVCLDLSNSDNAKVMQASIPGIATLIVIGYSMFGGIRSVTFTDVLQFITFTAIIPLVAWFIFKSTDKSVLEVASILHKEPKFQLTSCLHINKLLALTTLFLANLVGHIDPVIIQRIYMASSPIQARKLFIHAGTFGFIIKGFIYLIALFLFVKAPTLSKDQIWPHVFQNIPPIFKGFIAVSLLAMAMSTADSMLNTCAVLISHDIVGSIQATKGIIDKYKLSLARYTVLIVGICAMLLAFQTSDLLALLQLAFACFIPIITAPFLLAVYGFRGTSRTALIGMATGIVAILAWNKWIEPMTGIDGAFPCMLANGLAMLAAHYLLPHPAGTGWVPPDKTYQQWQQEKERITRRNKQERKDFFLKAQLAKFKPSRAGLLLTGIYLLVIGTVSFVYCYYHSDQVQYSYSLLLLPCIGFLYIGCAIYSYQFIPDWVVGSCWFFSLLIALPLHLLFSCFLCQTLLVPFILFFTHGTVLLWTLPFYWSLRALAITTGGMLIAICCCKATVVWPDPMIVLPLVGVGSFLVMLVVYFKKQNRIQQERVAYFLQKQATQEAYELKKLAYSEELPTASPQNTLAQEGTILEKAIQNVTQSIAFVDSTTPFLKEDFQSIIDKFAEWAYYFRSRAKRQDQLLLQPTAIPLEALIDAGEVAYQKEKGYLPGLWVEEVVNIPDTMLGDREQLVRLLFLALNHVRQSSASFRFPITLQLQLTQLRYKKREPLEADGDPDCISFPALALILCVGEKSMPTLQAVYDVEDASTTQPVDPFVSPQKVNLHKENLASIVHAHYGLLLLPHAEQLVCLLPLDVSQVREEMLALSLPREAGTQEEDSITPHEKTASLARLSSFHDWIPSFESIDPFLIAEILLLLRRCYGFKRHASGQLFYVRAVGIAEWVAAWTDGHAKLVYATLLYDLVRYTRLPLSYIKANYHLIVYCFVENTIAIDSRKRLEESLLAITNRLKESLQKEHISVLYVKLAERLYDLKQASGYKDPTIVQAMAKESLTIDVELAQRYGEPGMAILLKQAAEEALAGAKPTEPEEGMKP